LILRKNKVEAEFLKQITEAQGIIHKICRMYCDDEEHRKDLFQEILIQLWKSYGSFKGEAKFSTWLYRVALNVAIQDLRKTKKEGSLFFQTNQFIERESQIAEGYEDQNLKLMHKAIANLNKIEKAIIMLHLEDKSNEEIAKIIGITQNYVRVKMNRIKGKLRKTLTN